MTDDEIRAVREGAEASGWAQHERVLLRAVDELKRDSHLSDGVWEGLSSHYNTRQIMDIVFAVGQYNMLAMALNALGVQLDEGLPGMSDAILPFLRESEIVNPTFTTIDT